MQVEIRTIDELKDFFDKYFHKFTLKQIEHILNEFTGWSAWVNDDMTKDELLDIIENCRKAIETDGYNRIWYSLPDPVLRK